TGIVVEGRDVRLAGARVAGFRVGVHVRGSEGVAVADADVSDNFRQRLGSTYEREDTADWLWPHFNDGGEWRARYGAGLYVERSRDVAVTRLLARDVQNGIVLDRVEGSLVAGCDASFLSGWGLALWRASDNRVAGNRFDFCVRGYSHGVYNRGQDSAGILLFEQSSSNLFEANSVTHGGDGVFGFAGKEALGEAPPPSADFDYAGRGCNRNVFSRNDLSFAPAHGLEMTFSFDNSVWENLFEGNAICGVWFGYARRSSISSNLFIANGRAGYASERGGINAEHAQHLMISENAFEGNAVGVRIWSDDDAGIAETPWAKANGRGARANTVARNRFDGAPALELLGCGRTTITEDVAPERIDADLESRDALAFEPERRFTLEGALGYPPPPPDWAPPPVERPDLDLTEARDEVLAELGVAPRELPARDPRRRDVRDRKWIVMTEWGPYDWGAPWLQPLRQSGELHRYRLLGPPGTELLALDLAAGEGLATAEDLQLVVERGVAFPTSDPDGLAAAVVTVAPKRAGGVQRY
ncbi:MAG TPA: right-handed parallel beta-helix repeat-containing protein, partial [Planctomycetota bacterium]|nr:right-handed parallel beta-helix repeat-containing protein [Planctomycetota bacterium]